jgi:PAS domain S-box-containing protein
VVREEDSLLKVLNKAPVGIIAFSNEGIVEYTNESLSKIGNLYRIDFSALKGTNIFKDQIIPDADLSEEFNLLKDGIPFEKEIKKLQTIIKGSISLLLKGSSFIEENKFAGGILILEDMAVLSEAKKEKEDRNNLIENVFSKISNFVFVTDLQGKIKFTFGKELSNFGKLNYLSVDYPINNFFPISKREALDTAIEHVRTTKLFSELVIEITVNNKPQYFNCRIEPGLNKKRQVQFLFFILEDISGRVLENLNLRKERDELLKLQSISEALTDALFVVDSEGGVLFWNKAAESLFGYSRSEVYGKFFGRILGLFDVNYFDEIKKELDNSRPWIKEITVFKKNREKEIIEAKFTYTSSEKNEIIILCSNITKRALKEQRLELSEERYKNFISQTEEILCTLEIDGSISFVNQAFIKTLKYSENELLKKNIVDLIELDKSDAVELDFQSIEKLVNKKYELSFKSKYGNSLLLLSRFVPVLSEAGKIKRYNCYSNDISESKQEESNLLLFKALFEASNDGIALEKDKKLVFVNDEFANIFGYPSGYDLHKKELSDLVSESDVAKVEGYFRQIENGKQLPRRIEFFGKKPDGSVFYAEVTAAFFIFNKQPHVVMIARDVTEKKRSQQVIKDSEEKYRNLTENIDDFLFTFERVGKYLRPVFYTSSVEKVTGYTQTDLLGDSKLFMKIIHPDDLSSIKDKIMSLLRSKIQLSSEFELRIINKHGNIAWVRTKLNILRDQDGVVQKLYGLVSDISLRKKAEDDLKKSTDNLLKLNETKDRFISIISHDLRTPFSSILGFTDLLLNDEGLSEEEKRQYVNFIRESSNSMLSLVNSLLDWTRLQTGRIKFEPERIEAYKIIEKSFNALKGAAFQKDINLTSNVSADLFIFVDENLILQVFNNLISNAIKFTNKNGNITVSVSHSNTLRFLEFSVKDDGTGIRKENLDLLFNVDTKFTSEGTAGERGSGLGLSLVKEIIEKHGGNIWVESEFGHGSDFKFTLPIASANILLVDDSKTDKLLYSKILKHIAPDYKIEVASDGKEALDMILSSPPALVITDHSMPVMNGYELVKNVQNSDLKGKPPMMVLASELDRSTIHDYNELGIDNVFHKPVTLSDFKKAVEKALRQGVELK